LLGNGDGTFSQSNALINGSLSSPVSADFNSDGVPDLVTGSFPPGNEVTNSTVALVYLSAAAANMAPSPVSLGQVPVGQSSPPQTVTLTDLGTVSMSNFSLSTTGDFSQTNTCTSTLAISAQCQIVVTFTPTAPGPRTGTVVVADNALPNPQILGLMGTGEAPGAGLSPASLNFNVQEVGTTSAPQTVKLTNTGTQPLTVSSITPSANYGETNTCVGAPIQAGANCAITVTFSPAAAGPLNGTITITDNANNQAGSQQTVPLTGAGSTAAVYLSTGSLQFPSQGIGTVSPPQPVTLTNVGSSPVTITGVTASADFSETNTCNAPLAAGGSCMIEVSFAPTTVGTLNGTVTVTDSGPGSPETVILSGTGTGPVVSLSATSLTFPGQLVGTKSVASRITLTNTGTTALTVTNISASGDYSLLTACQKGVAPNANCVINVMFAPTQGGTRAGTLSITDNAAGSPQTVALTGTGQDFTLAIASGSSTTQSISPGGTATYTLNISGLGGLNTTVTFTCTGAPVRSTCSVSPAMLTPASTATVVTVTVTTQAASMVAPWFEETAPPSDGTNTKLILLALAGLMLLVGLGLAKRDDSVKPAAQATNRGYRIRLMALPALLLLLSFGVAACGGGNGMGSQTTPGTTAGTYTLTLAGTATVSSQVLMHNVPLTLTVK
ncbi:MAG: choice-of-anchor D domain-containing protein, partial [Terriglobia bacterium]